MSTKLCCIALLSLMIIAGCSTAPTGPPEGSSRFSGKSISKTKLEAEANHPVSEGYSLYKFGALGMLMADLSGAPAYFVYTVQDGAGEKFQIAAIEEHPVGTCFEFWANRNYPTRNAWPLGKAYVIQKPCP